MIPTRKNSKPVLLQVGTYVERTVLAEESAKKKGRAIKQFIKIAKVILAVYPTLFSFLRCSWDFQACRELNNFNTAFAIIWGLSRPSIVKLNQAWEVCIAPDTTLFFKINSMCFVSVLIIQTPGYF